MVLLSKNIEPTEEELQKFINAVLKKKIVEKLKHTFQSLSSELVLSDVQNKLHKK